jgi:hypothetical protein
MAGKNDIEVLTRRVQVPERLAKEVENVVAADTGPFSTVPSVTCA